MRFEMKSCPPFAHKDLDQVAKYCCSQAEQKNRLGGDTTDEGVDATLAVRRQLVRSLTFKGLRYQ